MANVSKIEWTETTWNFATGCTKISAGCKNCYAERMAKRLKCMGLDKYKNCFELTVHENMIEEPLKWKKPKQVFVNSMSDTFHKDVPDEIIFKVFETMNKAHWHTFQVLTKRSSRLLEMSPHLPWSKNIWMGVTVESSDYLYRINNLINSSAKVKFVSLEPLLGPLYKMDINGIDWVIVGGESGYGARDIMKEWVIDVKEKCQTLQTPFFFKQWGGANKKKAGSLLDGKEYKRFPVSA
ncbi:MAG: phage Gp37/Gp68 family protein [Deltaproteobacteria bacterium]|jgi:protein gp37|nr:phage Gp37/Gp68 family protein [Deltaproteobacteria bacterium]